MVQRQLPKLETRVQFPYPACRLSSVVEQCFRKAKVPSSNLGGGSFYRKNYGIIETNEYEKYVFKIRRQDQSSVFKK